MPESVFLLPLLASVCAAALGLCTAWHVRTLFFGRNRYWNMYVLPGCTANFQLATNYRKPRSQNATGDSDQWAGEAARAPITSILSLWSDNSVVLGAVDASER